MNYDYYSSVQSYGLVRSRQRVAHMSTSFHQVYLSLSYPKNGIFLAQLTDQPSGGLDVLEATLKPFGEATGYNWGHPRPDRTREVKDEHSAENVLAKQVAVLHRRIAELEASEAERDRAWGLVTAERGTLPHCR